MRRYELLLVLLLPLCLISCAAPESECTVVMIQLPPPVVTAAPTSLPAPLPTPTPAPLPTASTAQAWPMKAFKYKPEGYTTAANVNLREGPGTEYAVLQKMGSHAELTMLAESGEWYYVSAAGVEGFVSKEFARVGTPAAQVPSDKYSDEDIYLAAQMIHLEANGGTYEELQAVATVLANRIVSRKFPDTVEDNIFAEGQFTVANNRERLLAQTPGRSAIRAADSVLNGGERTFDSGVMYFRASSLGTEWTNREYYGTIGGHCFFR